jgi:leucyl-tRNA synthetase
MKLYDAQKIEKKWQREWERSGVYRLYGRKRSCYILDMFPYPSGAGLHVGHPKGYIASDVYARFKQLQGYGVLHPMGWDAFGLPAEQYAIKNNVHPEAAVKKNVATFKRQLQKMGFTYDWDREINTTDPEYYRWTQWIFLQMWKKGLAYESYEPINWCPSCLTGLANEDLEQGRCERCDSVVEKHPMRQWVLRITDYADKMLRDLRLLEWPEGVKEAQRNWIGRSEGTTVKFLISNSQLLNKTEKQNEYIEVFTTRVDTIFGCTYVVVAPEHRIIADCRSQIANFEEVEKYIEKTRKKTELERTELTNEKTGVKLEGIAAINPFNGEAVPVFVADYVLGSYGTGAVMAVPAHDERDFAFAKKYDLPMKFSVGPYFTDTEGKDAVRSDKPTVRRKTAYAFVKHWEEDKYLCLDWERFGWHSGIIGGIEDGEDPTAAARREIIEETGYQNPAFVKTVGAVTHNHFFAVHKDVNRYAEGVGLLFHLKNDEWQEPDEEEMKNHKTVWIPANAMRAFLNLKNFQYMWDVLETGCECYTEDGVVIESGEFTALSSAEARVKMTEWLERKKLGRKKVSYRLRDWVFSRQRYWGEPIPLIRCEQCGVVPVPEKELPVRLPRVKAYQPTGTGESPLAGIGKWVNVKCPKCHGPAERETNTMPQWAGSSWYYLRYIDPKNKKALVDKRKEKKMMPVDVYVGGDHATRHLIYARFWHKFLFDQGIVSTPEPFKRLEFLGVILAADGRKMSKRWGNVVNPDDVIDELGADAFRTYEMFMGPFEQSIAWNTAGVVGTRRFLEKVWKLGQKTVNKKQGTENRNITSLLHQTIKKVTDDIEEFKFNTAVSALMILVNALEKEPVIPVRQYALLLLLLSPFAPHIAEELWAGLGERKSIFLATWPKWDRKKIVEDMVTIVVQVNGKVRDRLTMAAGAAESALREAALASVKVQVFTVGKEIRKTIVVPGKLVNIVV